MEQKLKLTSDQVANELKQLCEAKCSGIVFMMAEKNIMLQIVLTEGDIVSVVYQTKRGTEALELIQSFEFIHFTLFNFIPRNASANKPKVDLNLPPRSDILESIRQTGQSISQTEGMTFINIEVPAGIGKSTQRAYSENVITHNLTKVIEIVVNELTFYLGPIAPMVCDEHLNNAIELSDVLDSLDKIASAIDDDASEVKFKQQVIKKLQDIS